MSDYGKDPDAGEPVEPLGPGESDDYAVPMDALDDIDVIDDATLMKVLVPRVTSRDQLLMYQAANAWMEGLEDSSKKERATIHAKYKAWVAHKEELKADLREFLASDNATKTASGGKARTILGSTYTQKAKPARLSFDDEEKTIEWLLKGWTEASGETAAVTLLRLVRNETFKLSLTSKAKDSCRKVFEDRGDIPDGCTVVTPETSIANRISAGVRAVGPGGPLRAHLAALAEPVDLLGDSEDDQRPSED